jgi:hypothetical protein
MSGYVALLYRFQKLQVMGGIFNHHFNVPIATFTRFFGLQNTGIVPKHQIPRLQAVPVLVGAY